MVSHDIADNIEKDFKRDMDIDLVVHLDPLITDDETLNSARLMVAEILLEIDKSLTHHDFRMVKCATHSNLIFDVVVPAEFSIPDDELIDMIVSAVHSKNRPYECIITVDKNYSSSISTSQKKGDK